MRVLISAGEASGELYGAQLMEALRRREPNCEFFGVGGEKMRDAGCETLIDARELSVVGLTEVLPHLAGIYRKFRKLIREAAVRKPDLAVVIDSPAFNIRVAREIHQRGVPVFYYVAPQFWAWRQGRVRWLRRYVRKALVIFPFEEKWYQERGVEAEFVGHPLADLEPPSVTRQNFAEENGLDPEKKWIALLPGSRRKEFSMNLPALLAAAESFGPECQFILPLASTLDSRWAAKKIGGASRAPIVVSDARAALRHARAAAVASGTATVEATLMGTPFVMVYRVSPLTYRLGKPLVKVQRYAMVNLIAGKEVVPELVQREFTAKNVAARLREILPEGPAREKMKRELAEVRAQLQGPDGKQRRPAAERAAEAILRNL